MEPVGGDFYIDFGLESLGKLSPQTPYFVTGLESDRSIISTSGSRVCPSFRQFRLCITAIDQHHFRFISINKLHAHVSTCNEQVIYMKGATRLGKCFNSCRKKPPNYIDFKNFAQLAIVKNV